MNMQITGTKPSSGEPIANERTHLGFTDGDRVRDLRTGCTGRVRFIALTAEERAEGCAEAEVVWDGFCSATELDLALDHGLVQLR